MTTQLPLSVLLACGLAAAVSPTLAGEVVLEGTVALPPAKPAPAAAARYQPNTTEPVAQPEPPTAVVYLEGNVPPPSGPPPVAQLGQKGFQFTEALLPVRRGTRVEFPNLDDAYHNVFSYSKPKRFDLGRYRKDEKPASQVFEQPGVVKLYCEIHSHMRATILVLETPHFVKTDPQGHYRLVLTNAPPGQYQLKAWIDEKVIRARAVDLPESGSLRVDFPG